MSTQDYFIPSVVPWFRKQADNIQQQINTDLQFRLDSPAAAAVWRTEGVENGLVRWDDRHPDIIFKDGFVPRANPPESPQLRSGLTDLWRYIVYHDFSVFVSTTRPRRVGLAIERWAPNDRKNLFEYTIYAYGGIDANSTLGSHKYEHQYEISFPGGIKREFLYCARQYDANGTVIRVWINRAFDLMANGSHQVPLFKLPDVLNWSVGVQITHWLAPGKYEYYNKLPTESTNAITEDSPLAAPASDPMHQPGSMQIDHSLSSTANPMTDSTALDRGSIGNAAAKDDDPMWKPGKQIQDPFLSKHPIRASLPLEVYGYPKDAWFFTNDQCARITIDGTDKLVSGPFKITEQWKSIKDLGFSTVDALLPFKGGAFVFSKEKYGRISIDAQLKDKKASGPANIADGWKSINNAGLRAVDAALRHPTKSDEAWIFHGKYCAQVKFHESSNTLVDGPFIIVDKFTSLKDAGYDSVDSVFPSSKSNEVWFFKGTRNVFIDITANKSRKDVNSACHDWKSLVQAKFY